MITYTTFQDVIDHLTDYLGGEPSASTKRDCVRAAIAAFRDLVNAHTWSYYYKWGRVVTQNSVDSTLAGATIQYQQTAGAYPRQLTISGGTWPDWAANGIVRIGGISGDVPNSPYDSVYTGPETASITGYKVDQRISATILTMDEVLAPAFDIPAGTDFLLYQDTYILPDDFVAQDQALYELNFGGMKYTHPREWLFENRYIFASGVPQYFTITGEQKYPGRLVTRMFPWPFQEKTVDFVYKRRPSQLYLQNYATGTVALTAGSTTITGTSTNWTPNMVGSIIRVSANATAPTSLIMGTNVGVFESVVLSYVSPTELVVFETPSTSYSGVAYTLSNSVDIEPGAMLNAYLRCCEKHIGMQRVLKDKPSAAKQYQEALSQAKSADSRSMMARSVNQNGRIRPRLRDMPIDLTQTF